MSITDLKHNPFTNRIISNRIETAATLLLIALPCVTFLYLAIHFCLNAPFYDDFSVILKPIRRALSTNKPWAFRQFMMARNQGHLPLMTHAIAWVQVKYLGGINFKWSTIAGDVGAIASVMVLVLYLNKKYKFRLAELVPIPFLLLSIVHWESMDFMVPAWQFYWGACLFPLLCFISIIEKWWISGALMFAGALFLSSGSLVLFPLAILFFIVNRQWKNAAGFTLLSGSCLYLFFQYFSPERVPTKIPDPLFLINYVTAFMGNLISVGQYDLQPLAWLHKTLGILIMTAGFYGFLKIKGGDFFKLTFIYVLALAFMAIYVRGEANSYVPSRYSLFALMGVIAIVYFIAIHLQSGTQAVYRKQYFLIVSLVAIMIWIHSLYFCIGFLNSSQEHRNNAMAAYQATRDKSALADVIWDVDLGEELLLDAKKLGVYDFTTYQNILNNSAVKP